MLFHLRTENTIVFKTLIDSLKEIMIETNVHFSESGIKVYKMNSIETICCIVSLSAEKLNMYGSYTCQYPENNPLIVGINLLHFSKILRSTNVDNIVHLELHENNMTTLQVKIETTNRLVVSNYLMNFIEVNDQRMRLPTIENETQVLIDSKYFLRQIKDLNNLNSNYVDIKATDKQLIITGCGGFISRETIIAADETLLGDNDTKEEEPPPSTTDTEETSEKNKKTKPKTKTKTRKQKKDKKNGKLQPTVHITQCTPVISQGRYATKDLLSISKFSYLTPTFDLSLTNNVPLILTIDFCFGQIKLIVNNAGLLEVNNDNNV